MSNDLLGALARHIAAAQWAENGDEAVIADRLQSSAARLPSLFDQWGLDFARQEELLVACLGFKPRASLTVPLGVPIIPARHPEVQTFLATRPALLFKPLPDLVLLGTSDPLLGDYSGQLGMMLGVSVEPLYLRNDEVQAGRRRLGQTFSKIEVPKATAPSSEEELDDGGPVVQFVDLMIHEAIQRRASDIHLEPMEESSLIRFRVDGVLTKAREYEVELHSAIASRVKLMAGMDIAEHRVPQDGRIRYDNRGADVDLRASSLPSAHGETIVLRILNRASVRVDLGEGGFEAVVLAAFRKAFSAANGIILVTGPTGSGKTTTLYGMLQELNDVETKIFTIEDPIEYQVPGIVQVAVNPKVGLTFAAGLRAFLRQDPDIVMVGEIRDQETAEIAIKAALTGHLVVSTLHTNGAPETLARLVDIGCEPYNLSATIQGILAQRLVRRVCAQCAEEVEAPPNVREIFARNEVQLLGPILQERGCEACDRTGFRGRMGLHEFLPMSEELKLAINRGAPAQELGQLACGQGMRRLLADGLIKAAARQTTLREVLRVVGGTVESSK